MKKIQAPIRRFIGALALLALTGCVAPHQVKAQFIGYTSQQSTTSVPFSGSTCTAALAAGSVPVSNLGQGAHSVTLVPTSTAQTLTYSIQGSYDGLTFFDISDTGTNTVNSGALTGVSGTGYYPVIAVKVSACAPGASTVTLKYSGISLTPGPPAGTNQQGQLVKNIAVLAPANTTLVTSPIRSPFGNAAGMLSFVYTGAAGAAGGTLSISCGVNNVFTQATLGPFPLVTTQSLAQSFPVSPSVCPWFSVTYTTGGASAASFNLDYGFTSLALPADPCQTWLRQSAAITAAAAATTQIIPLTATLAIRVCGYQVGQAATAGTLQFVYGTGVNCGTGTTNLTGAIPVTAAQPITYTAAGTSLNVPIGNALCLTTTGAGGTAAGVVSYVQTPY